MVWAPLPAIAFILARPFSKSSPIIRSMFMARLIAFAGKLFRPSRLHVTAVRSPSGRKVNVDGAGPGEGPHELELDPDQLARPALDDGRPAFAHLVIAGPRVDRAHPGRRALEGFFIAGSRFAYGDQASHLWKSFTWAKTTGAGAETVAARSTRNSDGRVATTTTSTTTIAATAIRILRTMMAPFPPLKILLPRATA